jgi:hypothetical protein
MSDEFNLEKIINRQQFPGGPNEDPGIRLSQGYLPGKEFAGGLEYMHARGLDNGQIIPSETEAVDSQTGEILQPGEIFIIDTSVQPPKVVKKVGSYILKQQSVVYKPEKLF